MWNCDLEYENQETPRQWYEKNLRCKTVFGCAEDHSHRVRTDFLRADQHQEISLLWLVREPGSERLEAAAIGKRQNRICKGCGKAFTPKRSDAVYCCNACRQRAYRQSVTDKTSAQIEHLP